MSDVVVIQGYRSLAPLIRAVASAGQFQIALIENFDKIELNGCLSLDPYVGEGFKLAQTRIRELFGDARPVFADPSFQAQFQFEGHPFFSQIETALWAKLQQTFAFSMAVTEGFRRFWLAHRPRLLVLANDVMPHTKALTFAAQRLGVPVLHVAHGSPPADLNTRVFADRIALYGPRDREWYAARGNDREKLAVTGASIYDYCPTFQAGFDRAAVEQELGLTPGCRRVLFLSTWVHDLSVRSTISHIEASFRATARICRGMGDVDLLVKPHPATLNSSAFYQHMAKEEGTRCRVIEGRLPDLIGVSDGVLCFDSNSGVEAMLLDKPVIALRFPPWKAELFAADDAALIAHDEAELRRALVSMLDDPEVSADLKRRRQAVSIPRFNYLNDGQAQTRIMALMSEMIAEGRSRESGLTLVVHVHDQLTELKTCLDAWQAYEVLVVDHSGDEQNRRWLIDNHISWISGKTDSEAVWRDIQAATRGEWLLLADGPILPVDGDWRLLMTRLKAPNIDGVSPQILADDGWAGIGAFWSGEWQRFGAQLDPASELAGRVWHLPGLVGGVVLRRRGQTGARFVYSPELKVKTLGWKPARICAGPPPAFAPTVQG